MNEFMVNTPPTLTDLTLSDYFLLSTTTAQGIESIASFSSFDIVGFLMTIVDGNYYKYNTSPRFVEVDTNKLTTCPVSL